MSKVTIKLEFPVEFAGDLIEEISLRRATGKDLKATIKGMAGVGESLALAARLSDQLPAVFDLMDAADVSAVLDEVGKLIQSGR